MANSGNTLFDLLWETKLVQSFPGGMDMLYIDRHLIHEGSAVYAFADLERRKFGVARPQQTFGVVDHIVPTLLSNRRNPAADAAAMMRRFEQYCRVHKIWMADAFSEDQGISHVFGHELGITLPGISIACSDSHAGTHGALGALSIPIGVTEMVQILATQTILTKRPRVLCVELLGKASEHVSAKDIILAFINKVGVSGASGCAIEFFGSYVDSLSLEGRLTLCNMSKEAAATTALIAPDLKVFEYIRNRRFATCDDDFIAAQAVIATRIKTDARQSDISMDVANIAPMVSWGTTPQDVVSVNSNVPDPKEESDVAKRTSMERALSYMGLRANQPIKEITLDSVFIGSCTNGRIEDLRAAAAVLKGRRIAPNITGIVVPGSTRVKRQAEAEGLDKVFISAGLEWRESGCSLCLAMNGDEGRPGSRIASTSNRNFEGRQGQNVRTHLVSPAMAACAAIAGRFTDVRDLR